MEAYLNQLANPFSEEPLKIHDGRVGESSIVKLRTSGTHTMTFPLSHFYIVPSVGNSVVITQDFGYPPNTTYAETVPSDHVNSLNTVMPNALYHRLVSTGVRLRMLNNIKDDDGYWEAVRVPVIGQANLDFALQFNQWMPTNATALFEQKRMGSSPSYQTGKLRDLHKFVFKLNHENNQYEFDSNIIKRGFDMIYIRLIGRNAAVRTRIHWNCVSNQEIVWREGTRVSTFHTPCFNIPNVHNVFKESRNRLPGQVTDEW